MKASRELKEFVMSLKDRVCALDQGLVVDPRSDFDYGKVYQEINLILLMIEIELLAKKRRKK